MRAARRGRGGRRGGRREGGGLNQAPACCVAGGEWREGSETPGCSTDAQSQAGWPAFFSAEGGHRERVRIEASFSAEGGHRE
eukprot:3494-Chlamydomonas_euryale.AAC.1